MKKILYLLYRPILLPVFLITLFLSQTIFSQTWVRKVDGFSMWSIAKDFAGNIYAGTTGSNRGIFKSTDSGETWTNMFSTGASNYLNIACDSLNNVYVANASNGLLISTDGGQNFTLVPSSTFNGNTLNAVACGWNGLVLAGATNGGIWRSTDYGQTFTNTALQTNTIVTITVDKYDANIIYAGSSSTGANGFFISTDGGQTFGFSTLSLNIWEILQTSPNVLYTATTSSPYPFSKSTDGGLTWTTTSNQPGAMRGATLDLNDNIYISGNGGVFKSTDGGASFVNHNLTFSSNKILTYSNKIMVCATGTTNGGVWIFTDTSIPVELQNFTYLLSGNDVILKWTTATEINNAGFEIEKREKSETGSKKWVTIDFVEGNGTTASPEFYSYTDKNVPAGSYEYRLKQIDYDGTSTYSGIVEVDVNAPQQFSLDQNYPNPFNPTTKINYKIPFESFVTLKVYNILGSEVRALVNEKQTAGNYDIIFYAEDLPSGIYYYQLKVNSVPGGAADSHQDFNNTKKMILVK
jgi:hypothetical protein